MKNERAGELVNDDSLKQDVDKPRKRRVRQPIETRATLLRVARSLFTEQGYHATGTHEIVAKASVTRGALCHHFPEKRDLFEAVFKDVARQLNQETRAKLPDSGDTWSLMVSGFSRYLELVAASREYRQILLIDGPAVLGWQHWRELQSEFTAADIAMALKILMKNGLLPLQPELPLAHILQAAVHDAALAIAYSAEPAVAEREVINAVSFLTDSLRRQR